MFLPGWYCSAQNAPRRAPCSGVCLCVAVPTLSEHLQHHAAHRPALIAVLMSEWNVSPSAAIDDARDRLRLGKIRPIAVAAMTG